MREARDRAIKNNEELQELLDQANKQKENMQKALAQATKQKDVICQTIKKTAEEARGSLKKIVMGYIAMLLAWLLYKLFWGLIYGEW